MLELSDEKVWEVSKVLYNAFQRDQTENRLNQQLIGLFKKNNIKPLYPHKINEYGDLQKYSCNDACCTVDPGRFLCCNSTKPDGSFRKLGLGLCLYFKFMKHSTIVFMLMSLLTLLSIGICFLVSIQNGNNLSKGYQTVLFSTTLGSFSSQHLKCQYLKTNNTISTMTFNLQCPYGKINLFGPTYSNQSSNSLFNCKQQIAKYQKKNSLVDISTQIINCTTKGQKCTINLNSITANNYNAIAYSYQCLNQVYLFGTLQAKSQYLLYVVIAIDLICCFIFIIFYFSQSAAEKIEIKYFKSEQFSLDDFSLKITGLDMLTLEQEFETIIQKLTNIIGQELVHQIVSIKLHEKPGFIEYQNLKMQAYQELFNLLDEQFFDNEINPSKFKNANDFINLTFGEIQYQKYKQKLTKLVSNYQLITYNMQKDNKSKICSIFIVLNSVKMKKRIYDNQIDGCFSKYYKFNNKEYFLSEPPAPDLIIWKNKGKFTFFRLIISWIITLTICFCSYMLFGYIQLKEKQFLAQYNFNVDCGVLYTSNQLTTYIPSGNSADYLTCFCQQNLFNTAHPDYSVCTQWRKSYITYLATPIIISFLLIAYNVVVSAFFKVLTRIQAHRLVTDQLVSYAIKRSFLLIMNMALIIILLNINYGNSIVDFNSFSFLLQGKFNDITADWYMNIGTIVILTMIFNIAFPIIELAFANILKCIRRCIDRRFCCRITSCKTKKEYIELYNNDIYPIQERYAFIMAIIIITMTFSCIIPILNLICGLSLMLLYFSDKVLLFKVYQFPVNYGHQLHKLIKKTLYIGIILHFLLTAVFLSQSKLLAQDSSFNFYTTGNSRINSVINVYYIVPYTALFLIFVGWSLFQNTFIALCDKCTTCCAKSLTNITKYKLQHNFYEALSAFQVGKLILMIKGQLSKIVSKNNAYRSVATEKANIHNETLKTLTNESVGLQFKLKNHKQQIIQRSMSHYQGILKRTLMKLQAQQSLRRNQMYKGQAHLIGAPGYQLMMNDEVFQQNQKNTLLTNKLDVLLKQEINKIQNE